MRGGQRQGAGRKPGSPNKEKKPGAKRAVIHVRIPDDEHARLLLAADEAGESTSEFIREAIRQRCCKESK